MSNIETKESSNILPIKEELKKNIREWIKNDNDITLLKKELKEKNDKQKSLSLSLINIMKTNSIDCVDIQGGSLLYKKRKSKKPISCKFLVEQLNKYYSNQPDVALEITEHLLKNRENVLKDEIKRKINK